MIFNNQTRIQIIPTAFNPPTACSVLGAAESMMGIDAPIVVFKQFKKFISVPGGKAISAEAGGAAVLLSLGAFEGKFAVLL
jgi:hypothetical protein